MNEENSVPRNKYAEGEPYQVTNHDQSKSDPTRKQIDYAHHANMRTFAHGPSARQVYCPDHRVHCDLIRPEHRTLEHEAHHDLNEDKRTKDAHAGPGDHLLGVTLDESQGPAARSL